MEKTTFTGMVKAVAGDETHPLQQRLRFVFTDHLPNKNKQGVPVEETDNIVRTAINQPVKVNFRGTPKGHGGAIPIGPIVASSVEGDRVIAEAIVWRNEFPDVAKFLDMASAEEGGAQFSWELFYGDSELKDNVQWLKDCIVAGVTIVGNPAYQGRTPLLAVAEENFMEELQEQLKDLTTQLTELKTQKEQEITDLKGKLAIAEEQAGKVSELESKVSELNEYKNTVEADKARQSAVAELRKKIAEAGIDMSDDQFDARVDSFLAMTEPVFDTYLKDLATFAKSGKAAASTHDRVAFPDPVAGSNQAPTVKELVEALRKERGK